MENFNKTNKKLINIVRLGGLTMLIGLVIHVVANMVLKTMPSLDLTLPELQTYLSNESDTWTIVHGMRYVALFCIVIFSAGLFVQTCCHQASRTTIGWGVLGLIGTTLMMSNLMITNGIEILTFIDFGHLSEQKELFWLLYYLTRVLWTAEIATWGVFILGFSIAGLQSRTIPKWIVILGLICTLACLLSAIFVVSILKGGWAILFIEVASLTGLLWFASVGIYMLFRKNSQKLS